MCFWRNHISHTTIDAFLCILWTLSYTLVLIGTVKYKYPLMSPYAQIVIASLEFATMVSLLISDIRLENHVFIVYLIWTILEIAIIALQIKQGFIKKKYVLLYVIVLTIFTLIMCFFVAHKGYQLFFALFNTVVGEILWIFHIRKKDYPMKPMVLIMFLSKFVADAMSVPVYYGRGNWVHNIMGIFIPVLDYFFIHIYFTRIINSNKSTSKIVNKILREGVGINNEKNNK